MGEFCAWTSSTPAVANVYAPSVPEKRSAFFSEELPRAMEGGGYVLEGGDFNCVTQGTDADCPRPGDVRFAGRDQLGALMLVHDLDDARLLPQVKCRGDGCTVTWITHDRQFTRVRLNR